MKFNYSLKKQISGFDFYNWLVLAKARGATEIVFDDRIRPRKWTPEVIRERFESILLPGPELFGLPHSFGKEGARCFDTDMGAVVRFCRKGGKVHKFSSPSAGSEKYTITLRTTQRIPERNSNENAWRSFAKKIGARIIEDYDKERISIHDRLSLYAGAQMNFFVPNGPNLLCSYTDYPYMTFSCDKDSVRLKECGIDRWQNLPWANADQRLIFEPDNEQVISRYFEAWLNG